MHYDNIQKRINSLNIQLKIAFSQVAFEDVLAEPDSTHSIDCVWINSYRCFTVGKNCCYKFLSAMCGLCLALYWGCEFASITFEMVWCYTPLMKVYSVYLGLAQKWFTMYVNCCLVPICEACGMCFSQITVKNVS